MKYLAAFKVYKQARQVKENEWNVKHERMTRNVDEVDFGKGRMKGKVCVCLILSLSL